MCVCVRVHARVQSQVTSAHVCSHLSLSLSCAIVLVTFLHCLQEPDKETGDIIIVLDEKEHERFGRKGSDLLYKMVCCHNMKEHFAEASASFGCSKLLEACADGFKTTTVATVMPAFVRAM